MPGGEGEYYVGVDLGGTWTKVGLCTADGEIVARESIPTRAREGGGSEGEEIPPPVGAGLPPDGRGPDSVVREIARTVDELVGRAGIARDGLKGIGIGSPGPLDIRRGLVVGAANLGWWGVPLRGMITGAVGLRSVLENDANAAAYGEWWKGAGIGASSLVCLTLGTGVGGGIVIEGKIWRGASDVGGAIGHMTVVIDGRRCNCGNRGCLEAYASATAIRARAIEGIEGGRRSDLVKAAGGDLRAITSEIVYRQAVEGDPFSREVLAETARYLAVGVANVLNVVNPEVVVIGGGVAAAGDLLFEMLTREVRGRALDVAVEAARIVPSALGNDAGLVGAAGLAIREFGENLVP